MPVEMGRAVCGHLIITIGISSSRMPVQKMPKERPKPSKVP
jgi:hypothetical protein